MLFWSFVKSRTGYFSIPSCTEYNGQSTFAPKGRANIFNKFFHSVFRERSEEMDNEVVTPFTESMFSHVQWLLSYKAYSYLY